MEHILKVPVTIQERKNPQDLTAPSKYYVQATKSGTVGLDMLAYLIANQSTVREPDCLAVLSALVHNMKDELAQGRVVSLDGLGNFQIGVRSEGSETQDAVSSANVKSAHINFRPSKKLKKALQSLDFSVKLG